MDKINQLLDLNNELSGELVEEITEPDQEGKVRMEVSEPGDIAELSQALSENRYDYEINLRENEVTATYNQE
ncbi:MAG: hypothetical protein ABEK59_04910 [Halobacteria archaeon]